MWRPTQISAADCARMSDLRKQFDCTPLVIHTSYLVNLCSQSDQVRRKSIDAFHGEIKRALALGAEYLVLHPGSWRGLTRERGLALVVESISRSIEGIELDPAGFRILIENTAGAEFSLGGSFEQVAELIARLKSVVPIAACLDTCHCHVAGYDLVDPGGYDETIRLIDSSIGFADVRVWHTNDAKAARGSKLDRHEQIGQGMLGLEPFRRLLNDSRFRHCAFIAEVPVIEPDDDEKNVRTLRGLAMGERETALARKRR